MKQLALIDMPPVGRARLRFTDRRHAYTTRCGTFRIEGVRAWESASGSGASGVRLWALFRGAEKLAKSKGLDALRRMIVSLDPSVAQVKEAEA